MMIGIGMGAENFLISGTFFVAISFVSSGVQKKENSDSVFRCGDVGDAMILVREAISYAFSASGIQKKDRSETGFVHRDTGDEMNFVGGAI